MTDAGATALAGSTAVRSLKRLDLHRNYLSPEGIATMSRLDIAVAAGDPSRPATATA